MPIETYVFEREVVTLPALGAILAANWADAEPLRATIVRDREKWGNHCQRVDRLARRISDHIARRINGRANARTGRFKAALISIDHNLSYGKLTKATPDGRLAGEPLSRNIGPAIAMDRCGITALIHSVTQLDNAAFPNGSVLDVVLHQSAVAGEQGLAAFVGIIRTFCAEGGFAIHLNVFDAKVLKAAQARPEDYPNLQVRVCGWNVYFVNLSREEQDLFIRQAEHVQAGA